MASPQEEIRRQQQEALRVAQREAEEARIHVKQVRLLEAQKLAAEAREAEAKAAIAEIHLRRETRIEAARRSETIPAIPLEDAPFDDVPQGAEEPTPETQREPGIDEEQQKENT